MATGELPQRGSMLRFVLAFAAAGYPWLICDTWESYASTSRFSPQTWQWDAEFGVPALVFQLAGLSYVRWDRRGSIASQVVFSLLLGLWAIGLVGPLRPLETLYPRIDTLLRCASFALIFHHWRSLLPAFEAHLAASRAQGKASG